MRRTAAFLCALVVLIALGCSSPDPCSGGVRCPAGSNNAEQCKMTLASWNGQPCRSEVIAYYDCAKNYVVCNAQGGMDDSASQEKAKAPCASSLTPAKTCCTANPSAAPCK